LVILHQFFNFIGNFIFELNVNHLVLGDLESLTTQVHWSRGIFSDGLLFKGKAGCPTAALEARVTPIVPNLNGEASPVSQPVFQKCALWLS